jgi:chromosome partitioning protein
MKVVVVANAKGGSAKTTTCVNLAGAWAEQGYRVLLVDMDPQASASDWIGVERDDGRAFAEVLMDEAERSGEEEGADLYFVSSLPKGSSVTNLDIVSSGRWVGRAERAMGATANGKLALSRVIAKLSQDRWDLLIIDCPPAVGLMTVNALAAATDLIVPVEAHGMALSGVKTLMEVVGQVREGLNPKLSVLSLIACRATRTILVRDVIEALRQRYGDLVAQSIIREGIRVAEAPSHHLPVTAYDSQSGVAADYTALAMELAKKLQLGRHAEAV